MASVWARSRGLRDGCKAARPARGSRTCAAASTSARAECPALTGSCKIALAEAEARAGGADRAIAILDEALATSDRTRPSRVRSGTASRPRRHPAEARPRQSRARGRRFLTAIAVAKQQGTRSFELRAALSLAKLYQSTARPADAHAVLAPALEGFSPTPEMPEIAEAQALLTALAETEEVKADAAQRQRLTHLHVAYGNALIAARGYGAPETTEAFARARERLRRTRTRRTDWRRTMVCGRQLRARRVAVDAGARGGFPQ